MYYCKDLIKGAYFCVYFRVTIGLCKWHEWGVAGTSRELHKDLIIYLFSRRHRFYSKIDFMYD